MRQVEIYTDGSSYQNFGGWAYVVVAENQPLKQVAAGFDQATNNRAELLAVIHALEDPEFFHDDVTIVSDSAYVVNCLLEGWYKKWLLCGWRTSTGQPVRNQDLWEELLRLLALPNRGPIQWKHIRGHSDTPGNVLADQLCGNARLDLAKLHQMDLPVPEEA